MMRGRDKRLGRVEGAINAAPVQPHVLDEAYGWFTDFGELPEEIHVARAVVQKALRGGEGEGRGSSRSRVRITVATSPHDDMPTVREPLFEEALDDFDCKRDIARAAIALEVANGGNVESVGFAGRHGLPMFGSVGLHVLGYPRKWIRPPYEFQGQRLLTRWDDLRSRIDHRNPKWAERVVEATFVFRRDGALPDDEVTRGLVLADAELMAHRANAKGRDVKRVMGWFDLAARGDDDERAEAVRLLGEAAKAGKLRWKE